MPRSRDKSSQPVPGEAFGVFRITGEGPTRNARGSLAWDCECIAALHRIQIEHAGLTYGAIPDRCPACEKAAREQRAQQNIEVRKLVKELAAEMREKSRAARIAQGEIATKGEEQNV